MDRKDGFIIKNGIVYGRVYGFSGPLADDETFSENLDLVVGQAIADQWPREKRNQLLKDSDWTQLADASLTDEKKLEWKQYRQLLRDLPTTQTDPINIVWPTQPTKN
jgi:hypothetical protein